MLGFIPAIFQAIGFHITHLLFTTGYKQLCYTIPTTPGDDDEELDEDYDEAIDEDAETEGAFTDDEVDEDVEPAEDCKL